MEGTTQSDEHMTSAAAFVEGGVQEPCDDACSICLEFFSHSDPSTVTNCKHEFHLQCILEWCQRSSNCPMCWQPVRLKDASSQQLLEAVETERKLNSNARLTLAATEAELEERVLQHMAAATMRRGPRYLVRDSPRNMSPSQANPHRPFFILSSPGTSRGSTGRDRSELSPRSPSIRLPNSPGARELPVSFCPVRPDQIPFNRVGSNVSLASRLGFLPESRFASQSSPRSQDIAGPSDFRALSESLRTRLTDWSTRYRESFSKNTRGWKERLFARSNSSVDFRPESPREGSSVIGDSSGSNDSGRSNMSNSDEANS